jgi:Kef-type K+ transport system membrane component KefB
MSVRRSARHDMILLLQIAVILALARVLRWLVVRLGQPAVVGEMTAGLLIGPSVLGWLMPRSAAALFPPPSLEPLNALSQVGLVLFMFIVGVRVGSQSTSLKRRAAAIISIVSIVVPFAMGVALSLALRDRLAPPGVDVWPFALFIGAAMSITAFPVLARILSEYQLLGTDIGQIAISCAAFDDVAGWVILAGILSLVHAGAPLLFVARLVWLAVYVAVMLWGVRPGLAWIARRRRFSAASADGLALMLLVALLSAAATDALGVHALFGAFFAGLMMPRGPNVDAVVGAVEPVTMTLLLPLFFAFTGLRTSLQLIDSPALVRDTLAVLATAVIGKGGASAVAARTMGLSWRDAGAIGVLVNTRGLIELVILNIGLEAGILSPVAFSMLVVMALVTTVMTSPLLTLVGLRRGGSLLAGSRGEPLQRAPVDLAARVDGKPIDENESPRNLVRR